MSIIQTAVDVVTNASVSTNPCIGATAVTAAVSAVGNGLKGIKITRVISNAFKTLPATTFIKAGILIGVAVFTCAILVKHFRVARKGTEDHRNDFCNYERSKYVSPVDELLGKGPASNPSIFDNLDEITKHVGKGCDILKGKRLKRKTKKIKDPGARQTVRDRLNRLREIEDTYPFVRKAKMDKELEILDQYAVDIGIADPPTDPSKKIYPITWLWPKETKPGEKINVHSVEGPEFTPRTHGFMAPVDDNVSEETKRKYWYLF